MVKSFLSEHNAVETQPLRSLPDASPEGEPKRRRLLLKWSDDSDVEPSEAEGSSGDKGAAGSSSSTSGSTPDAVHEVLNRLGKIEVDMTNLTKQEREALPECNVDMRRAVMKAHKGLGHCSPESLHRLFRMARAPLEQQAFARAYRCSI